LVGGANFVKAVFARNAEPAGFSELFRKPSTSEKTAPKIPMATAFRQGAPNPPPQGAFRLTGKGPFGGRLFSQLEEPEQQRFVDYALTVDVFVEQRRTKSDVYSGA
jgi:hypothetical protein